MDDLKATVNDSENLVEDDNETIEIEKENEDSISGTPSGQDNSTIDDGVGQVTSNIISDMPGVSENVIELEAAKQENAQENEQNLDQKDMDKDGFAFDSKKHMVDKETGKPVLTKAGKLRIKPGNASFRKQKTHTSKVGDLSSENENIAAAANLDTKYKTSGMIAASMLFTSAQVLGGEEWKPIINAEYGVNETEFMQSLFTDFFKATQMPDIPAGWALGIGIFGYALPRFTMPKTQSRFKRAYLWVKGKVFKKRVKKEVKKHAQSDRRSNEKREDDISETDLSSAK